MKRFRRTVHRLRRQPAGRRFQRMNDDPGGPGGQGQGPWARAARLLVGLILVLAGVFMLAVPGPGLLAILLGLAVWASAFRPVARLLDRGEIAARSALQSAALWWTEASAASKVAAVVLFAVLMGAAGWGAWVGLFGGR